MTFFETHRHIEHIVFIKKNLKPYINSESARIRIFVANIKQNAP